MVITEIINAVKAGQLDEKLTALYGADALASQKVRYEEVLSKAKDLLGDKEAHIFSAPGRTEVGVGSSSFGKMSSTSQSQSTTLALGLVHTQDRPQRCLLE